MAGRKKTEWRTKGERERDLAEIAKLYMQGKYQSEIAKEISKNYKKNISQQTISKDIAVIKDRWLASSLVDFNAKKSEELAKIDYAEREAFDAWERSKRPRRKTQKKQLETKDKKAIPLETKRETITTPGDPRFLQLYIECGDRRCKVLGLYEPERKEHTFRTSGDTGEAQHERRASRIADFILAAAVSSN